MGDLIGHPIVASIAGAIIGYCCYIIFLQIPINWGTNDVPKNIIFWCMVAIFSVSFAIGSLKAKSRFFCFCTSVIGAFLICKAVGYFVQSVFNDYAFPDCVGAYCTCLTEKKDCVANKYACKWDDSKEKSAACQRYGPASLDQLDLAGGIYLIIMFVLIIIGAPFQYYVSREWCGGSDENFEEEEQELDDEAKALYRMAEEIKKLPEGDAKRRQLIKEYNQKKKEYTEFYHHVEELEDAHGEH